MTHTTVILQNHARRLALPTARLLGLFKTRPLLYLCDFFFFTGAGAPVYVNKEAREVPSVKPTALKTPTLIVRLLHTRLPESQARPLPLLPNRSLSAARIVSRFVFRHISDCGIPVDAYLRTSHCVRLDRIRWLCTCFTITS